MRIVFYGGKQAGAISLLTILARREQVELVFSQDEVVSAVAKTFGIREVPAEYLNDPETKRFLKSIKPDLFVCVHGRKIVKKEMLDLHRLGGINVHPCLYKYKGASPITRLLADGETKASVGVHHMTEKVDEGEVIMEIFQDVSDCKSVVEVYNKLYPLYCKVLRTALDRLESQKPAFVKNLSLRPVKGSDRKLIFAWRNDESIRRNSFNTRKISWTEHQKYWDSRMLSKGKYSYMIIFGGKPSGVVRLDRKEGWAEIHLMVAPEYQGQGIGATAVQKAKLLAPKLGIRKIIARVKPSNPASQAIFRKNGFEQVSYFYECKI